MYVIHSLTVVFYLTYSIVCLIYLYIERTTGLLGFWDNSTALEFLLPNGTFIPTNSSSRTLHYEFGQKCKIYIFILQSLLPAIILSIYVLCIFITYLFLYQGDNTVT